MNTDNQEERESSFSKCMWSSQNTWSVINSHESEYANLGSQNSWWMCKNKLKNACAYNMRADKENMYTEIRNYMNKVNKR